MTTKISSASAEQAQDVHSAVGDWLSSLSSAIEGRDGAQVELLFADGAILRDLMAFGWDLRNAAGAAAIAATLTSDNERTLVEQFRVRPGDQPNVEDAPAGGQQVSVYVTFGTDVGQCEGFLVLARSEDGALVAASLVVQMIALRDHPEAAGALRPQGRAYGAVRGRQPLPADPAERFESEDPAVIVIGGGHNGLIMGARLNRLNVPTLVLERNERIGDNWRNRYGSLALHDPAEVDDLPFMPLPDSWPRFTPKQRFADYLESYATMLDIPVWTGAETTAVEFDDATQLWNVRVQRKDGSVRTLRSRHVVMSTGHNDVPQMPDLPGAETFAGEIVHSARFRDAERWTGKRVVVIGASVSGHDVAQELWEVGADVTMVQRSGIYIIDQPTIAQMFYSPYSSGDHRVADLDLKGATLPFNAYPAMGPGFTAAAAEIDKELHRSLEAAGFELGWGPDGQGLFGLVFRENRFSYYFNVGASQLVADGSIGIHKGSPVSFSPTGIQFDDGTELPADLVIFATGYQSVREASRRFLGELSDRLLNISTVGADGEMEGTWRQSGVENLWFAVSTGISYSRFYSKFLALRIKAIEAGLSPV